MTAYRSQLAEVDLGNLLVLDNCPLDYNSQKNSCDDDFLKSIALECSHHFFKLFWELPTELNENILVSCLPKPTFRLPREKKIPSPKELTRWDKFARLKGIQKRKRTRKVWDEATNSWKSRWGKDRVDDIKNKWVLEVPDNADPYEDQFEKLTRARKERQAKNELQRLRNIGRSVKTGRAPPIGVLTESQNSKNELTRALTIATSSDASMGKFSTPLDKRKLSKKVEKKVKQRTPLSQIANKSKKTKSNRASKKSKPTKKTIKGGKMKKEHSTHGGKKKS